MSHSIDENVPTIQTPSFGVWRATGEQVLGGGNPPMRNAPALPGAFVVCPPKGGGVYATD